MSHEIKDAIQSAAKAAWRRVNGRGLIAGATGVGKSKIAIDIIMDMLEEKPDAEIVVATPTEDLRDRNWPEEFVNWLGKDTWEDIKDQIEFVCYVSLHEVRTNRKLDLLVLDEGHHLTVSSARVFTNNIVEKVLALSATPPDKKRDEGKWDLLNQWAPVCFIYDINQAAEEGAAAEFKILVIKAPLDSINKNIESGPKAKRFLTTEMAHYNHLNNVLKKTLSITGPNKANAVKFATIRRAQFIYNLKSKTKLASELLKRLPEHLRIITFCGSIDQSRELFGKDVYNSKDKHPNMLDKFKDDLTMKRIGVVNAVDEGHNIPFVDMGIIVQTNSNNRTLVQRLGRIVRYREGHRAVLFVLCTQGTQDESWVDDALKSIDPQRITYIPEREIYSGEFLKYL